MCWEQPLTVQAEITKNSPFLPATSVTQTHLQRVAFFKTQEACYERTKTVLTHTHTHASLALAENEGGHTKEQ